MIAIINYGLGNIKALANVYKNLNIPHKIISQTDDLKDATKIILPGVGAFDYALELLQKSGLREPLNELVLQQKLPVLGICVGMQIMVLTSEEGVLPGLAWIDGVVKKFDSSINLPLPHMGWNNVKPVGDNKLFKNIETGSRFYFLHSYYLQCQDKRDVAAETDYGGPFTCAVNAENIYGVQFHPEKSHQNGIQLLKNFANL